MEEMIEKLLKGDIYAATKIAKDYSVKEIKAYLMDNLGWSLSRTFKACRCLKLPSNEAVEIFLDSED